MALIVRTQESTATSQECLKQHLKSAQIQLNDIYEKLSSSLDEASLVELKTLQKTWLTYRDAECMWAANKSENTVGKRIKELSCMALVTDDRADLLSIVYGDVGEPITQRELGTFPRWMNVVAKQYPDIYWQYGSRIEGDLNCDEQGEYVMTGVSFKGDKKDVHIAIIENPSVGKPAPHLFSFAVVSAGRDQAQESLCVGSGLISIICGSNRRSH